ncbi:MAG: hypothetical protein PHG97_04555 [Candidatus Margulisbacteria bacterium]|nr:hypothetical protein [Candidatus Margulisiibacteriota bacterium]
MKKNAGLLLLALLVMLSACAAQPRKTIVNNDDAPAASEEASASPSREAIFIYGSRKNLPARLILGLAGEPVLLPSGYVRLVGVVSGGRPIACLEIGGRGLALEKGETIDDYQVIRIDGDRVVLERRN